jgi:hypothetical protein
MGRIKTIKDSVISITKGRNDRYRQLYTTNKWFTDDSTYSINQHETHVLISKHFNGAVNQEQHKISKSNKITFIGDLPLGKYKIDLEDINEDELIFDL